MTTANKITQSDREFVIDVFQRSAPGKHLTAGQVARYCKDRMSANQVWAVLTALADNPDGSIKRDCDGSKIYYYMPAHTSQNARKQPCTALVPMSHYIPMTIGLKGPVFNIAGYNQPTLDAALWLREWLGV
jgi:hypothetical protein